MRLPPTRGAAFCTFLVVFCALDAFFWAAAADDAAGFLLVLFVDFFVSFAARMACSLCAFLTSGFWLRLARMSESLAPTTARWNFCVFFVRFFAVSSSMPLRCFLR